MGQPDISEGTKEDLVRYRIQTAKEDLKSARILLTADEYRGANNRAYYAIFHAVNAMRLEEKSVRRRRFVMQVIMTTSILQVNKRLMILSQSLMNLSGWLRSMWMGSIQGSAWRCRKSGSVFI